MSKKSYIRAAYVAGAAALATVLTLTIIWLHDWPVHHFGVVSEGVLYRGGQPNTRALERILTRYKIKTVGNLRGPSPDQDWWRGERDTCRKLGVQMVDVPVGDRSTAVSGLKEFLGIATDPANYPVFVHCEAGSARTGYAIAAYRIAVQGWNHDRAINEARTFRFDPQVNLNPQYDKTLRELAGGLDWRKLPDGAAR